VRKADDSIPLHRLTREKGRKKGRSSSSAEAKCHTGNYGVWRRTFGFNVAEGGKKKEEGKERKKECSPSPVLYPPKRGEQLLARLSAACQESSRRKRKRKPFPSIFASNRRLRERRKERGEGGKGKPIQSLQILRTSFLFRFASGRRRGKKGGGKKRSGAWARAHISVWPSTKAAPRCSRERIWEIGKKEKGGGRGGERESS